LGDELFRGRHRVVAEIVMPGAGTAQRVSPETEMVPHEACGLDSAESNFRLSWCFLCRDDA
jgi:hypothetical protein